MYEWSDSVNLGRADASSLLTGSSMFVNVNLAFLRTPERPRKIGQKT